MKSALAVNELCENHIRYFRFPETVWIGSNGAIFLTSSANLMLLSRGCGISAEISLRIIFLDFADNKST